MKIADALGADFWQGGDLLFPAIAAGFNQDVRIIRKVCQNTDIDTGTLPEDLWNGGGLYTGFPPESVTPQRLSVVSDNVNDTAAGTGARTVRIVGLNANWAEYEETVTLNGTTPVLTTGTFRRFTRAQVASAGTTTAGGITRSNFNAGTITGRYETDTAYVFFAMPVGLSNTRTGGFTTPVGWQGLIKQLRIEINQATAASIEGEIFFQTVGMAPRLIRPFTASNSYSYVDSLIGGVLLPEKTDIIPRVRLCSANNVQVYCSFEVILFRP